MRPVNGLRMACLYYPRQHGNRAVFVVVSDPLYLDASAGNSASAHLQRIESDTETTRLACLYALCEETAQGEVSNSTLER